jgi:PAS domain S-box-containing protein
MIRNRAVLDAIRDAVFLADIETGMIVDANRAAESLCGRSITELQSLHHSELHPPEMAESAKCSFEKSVQGPALTEATVLHKDGRRIPVEISPNHFTAPDGRRLLIGVFRDISERHAAREALRRSEERFRQIAEIAKAFIWEVDGNGLYLYANRMSEHILGYTPEELVGRMHFYDLFVPQTREETKTAAFEIFSRREPFRSFLNWNVRKDGRIVALQTSGLPILDAGGALLGYRGADTDITERRQTELRLLQIQAAVESASDAIGISDAQGRHFYQNKALTEMFGYGSAEELEAAGGGPAVVHDPTVAKDMFDTIRSGGSWSGELKLVTKDRRVFDAFERADAIKDEVGNVVGLIGVITDFTERKRAEEALRQSEERLRTLFENATVGIYRTTPAGRIEMANTALVRMMGYESFEALAEHNLDEVDFGPQYLRSAFREALEQQGQIQGLEAAWSRRDGSSLFVRESARCVRDETGAVLCYEGIVEEITERKRAEGALRASEEKFAAAFRLGPAAMSIVDLGNDNTMLDVNAGFEQASGYSRDELVGQRALDLGIWLEPDEHAHAGRRFGTDGRLRDFEFRFRRRSGEIRTGLLSAEPMEINNRQCAITCTIDVTERRQAEADREKLWAQLAQAQKMESIGRLAGGLAHDFNNLMSVVALYADSALDELRTGGSAVGSIMEIRETAEKAIALGRQLMAFSSKQVLQPEVLNLNSVIADSRKLVRRLIGEDINVVFKPGSGLGLVRADRGQLGQILMNLAVNSRDAMPEGGLFTIETANIEFDQANAQRDPSAKPGWYVMVAVSDTGIGMDEHTRAHVFEPFFTTKDIGKGTGLGLSVVYGIVKQSGGFITFASEPGRGADFRIYLPAVQATAKPIFDDEEAPIVGGTETLLLVEDEPALRNKIHEILEKAGYQVLSAPDGHQALQLSLRDARPIHLLITDMVMPEISGRRLSERLRALRPYTLVLYMSGYPHGDGRVEPQSLPNFIQKPFTKEKLLRQVRDVLDGNTPQEL